MAIWIAVGRKQGYEEGMLHQYDPYEDTKGSMDDSWEEHEQLLNEIYTPIGRYEENQPGDIH